MSWSTRNPKPKIKIVTKNDETLTFVSSANMFLPSKGHSNYPIDDVISITTTNSINSPSGAFSVELVWAGTTDRPVYYDFIRPMDIAIIYLDGEVTTMVGMIDTVSRNRSIAGGRVQRSITISGRSLGSIWEFDLVKYFEYTVGIPDELLDRNLNLQSGNIKLDFFGQNAITAIKTLYKSLPAIDIPFNGKTIKDYIDVGSELFVKKDEVLYNLNHDPYMGSVFDYFRIYIGQPFNEIWTESKDDKLYLRMRPTPFNVSFLGKHALGKNKSIPTVTENEDGKVVDATPTSWENIKSWNWKLSKDIVSVVTSTHTGKETARGTIPFHEIEKSDVIQETLTRTHINSYSIYGVLPVDRLYGNVPEYQALPPLIIKEDYAFFGSRDYIVRIGFIPLKINGGLEDTADKIFKNYRNLLYLWNKDNHRFENGTLTIKGNPYICVGDKIIYNGNEYYMTKVQHNWRYGKAMTTTLTAERGMRYSERVKRYVAGLNYLNKVKEAV